MICRNCSHDKQLHALFHENGVVFLIGRCGAENCKCEQYGHTYNESESFHDYGGE